MSLNLLDMLKDQVTGQLANQASSFLGESESSVTKALGGIFPSILGSMIKSGGSESGASGLLDMIKGVDNDMLGNIGGLFGGGASSVNGLLNNGGGIVNSLLGDKLGGIVDVISKVSGMKSGSSSSLLKMAAPFLLGMIGKQIKGKGVSGLMNLLMGQKDHVAKALPAGMGSLLGLGFADSMGKDLMDETKKTVANTAAYAKGQATNAGAAVNTAASSGMGWLKWLLPILAIAALGYWLMTKGGADKIAGAAGDAMDKTTEAVGDAASATTDAVKDAGNAVADAASAAWNKVDAEAKAAMDKITFAAGSAGAQMKSYIDGGFSGDSNFRFNNLNFDTGSAELNSATEVDNLAAILKAYPEVSVTINGYTDNTGDAAANKQLSEARAASVMGRLIAQGISPTRVKAVGHGDANPVADNGTAEGRAENRRIEVSINK